MLRKRKVGIVGAGAVGATAAFALTMTGSCREIVLYDIVPDVAIGKAIDIAQAAPYSPQGTIISAAESPSDMTECDIVVITAGVPRKGDMTRADLLMINAKIITDVVKNIKKYSPDAIIICVANPLDVMTYVVHQLTGWDRNRIIGMAGALDGARMAYQIQKKVGFGSGQVRAIVLGDHGENMIPYPQISAVGGVPLDQLLSKSDMDDIVQKTKTGGAEIVSHLKTSGYYAPGRAVAVMVEAILDDTRIVLPSSVLLDGEYGYKDVTLGVPVVLGSKGVEKIIELELNDETKAKLDISVQSIKDGIDILKENSFFS
ncbi:MAG: malate dehydrogenase [Sulfurovum sp.]|nr:MAG: malate dehydrogenase [Sulfurovum sp.]